MVTGRARGREEVLGKGGDAEAEQAEHGNGHDPGQPGQVAHQGSAVCNHGHTSSVANPGHAVGTLASVMAVDNGASFQVDD
ncbi:hypothetical protein M0220_11945 [Halomonas qinghailakensis]|uniref:Uncharacterized protein n=1 Tax=Halomonas qinghailakensis TaxID=2937790 RepID=A0AA46TNG2_9GAMM|nr:MULTISPECIES: hypothetical protein [Halomonas]UYO73590.1 hypothetical protein M0220_11945 [Halomonas sp. ZZQ-149]